MRPVILWRSPMMDNSRYELEAAAENFYVTDSRCKIEKDDLVIGRYSVLPYYKEQERDIRYVGAKLINSYKQHDFVADLWNWCHLLEDFTPKTWNRLEDVNEASSYVLKGATNSRKHLWKTHMYAKDYQDAIQVYGRLLDDSLIGQQNIYIRKYVPLVQLDVGANDLPITKEFRFFVCDGQVVSGGFYWSSHLPANVPSPDEVPKEFLAKVIEIIGNNVRFYALDVAQTLTGNWIVIELNDGQMSGLSENDPKTLYKNLKEILK